MLMTRNAAPLASGSRSAEVALIASGKSAMPSPFKMATGEQVSERFRAVTAGLVPAFVGVMSLLPGFGSVPRSLLGQVRGPSAGWEPDGIENPLLFEMVVQGRKGIRTCRTNPASMAKAPRRA